MALVTSIMRLQQVFLTRADAILRSYDLTFARYEVLMLLSFSRQGALPLGKIGERLQVNAASVTNAIDRLEARGLVTAAVQSRRQTRDPGLALRRRATYGRGGDAGHERFSVRRPGDRHLQRRGSCSICWPTSAGPPETSTEGSLAT